MGAASTVPVENNKDSALSGDAQPKDVFSNLKSQASMTKDNPPVMKKEASERGDDSKGTMKRKYSLEMMLPQSMKFVEESSSGRSTWPDNVGNGRIEVGDVVRIPMAKGAHVDGLVIEIINEIKILVDCGEFNKEVNPDECELVTKVMDFEEGDKVEVKPADSQLYFVGKIIRIHSDKTMDVLMEGDDPDDIEYRVSSENARKLMSRRALVINRWKRAFMMVLAANFFRRIHFYPRGESKRDSSTPMDMSEEKL